MLTNKPSTTHLAGWNRYAIGNGDAMTGRKRRTQSDGDLIAPAGPPSSWAQCELEAFVKRRIKQLEAEGFLTPEDDDEPPDWLAKLKA